MAKRKTPEQRRAEARVRFIAVLEKTGGPPAVRRYLNQQRRQTTARSRAKVAAVVAARVERDQQTTFDFTYRSAA